MKTSTAFSHKREQAIDRGLLIDVTGEARQVGLHDPVALSHAVWASCVEVYPRIQGVSEESCLLHLLSELKRQLDSAPRFRRLSFALALKNRTSDYSSRPVAASLNALCTPAPDGSQVVTVMLADESLSGIVHVAKRPVPLCLLLEMHITLSELFEVAEAFDLEPLCEIENAYRRLAAHRPAGHQEIEKHNRFALFPSPSVGRHPLAEVALSSSTQERRQKLLSNLQDLARSLRSVGLADYREEVETIEAQLQILTSPLAEMLHITAQLIFIAAHTQVPDSLGKPSCHPYQALLSLYARLAVQASSGALSAFPEAELALFQKQLTVLRALAPEKHLTQLCQIEKWIHRVRTQLTPDNPSFSQLQHPERKTWQDSSAAK